MYLITKSTYIFLAPHMNSLAPSKSEEQVGWALRNFRVWQKLAPQGTLKSSVCPWAKIIRMNTNSIKLDFSIKRKYMLLICNVIKIVESIFILIQIAITTMIMFVINMNFAGNLNKFGWYGHARLNAAGATVTWDRTYRVFIKYCVFSLKFCDFSELCQFCCSAGFLHVWFVYTHWHWRKTEKGQNPEYIY